MEPMLQFKEKHRNRKQEKELVISLSYFLDCLNEWQSLRKDSAKKDILKRFESLHGKAFVQSLAFFENVLEGRNHERFVQTRL